MSFQMWPDHYYRAKNSDKPPKVGCLAELEHLEHEEMRDGSNLLLWEKYWLNFDSGTDTFSDLAVEIIYNYSADKFSIMTETIKWYKYDGSVGVTDTITHKSDTAAGQAIKLKSRT